MFDHGVYGARHLGRDSGIGLAAQMGIVPVLGKRRLEGTGLST